MFRFPVLDNNRTQEDFNEIQKQDAFVRLSMNDDFKLFCEGFNRLLDDLEFRSNEATGVTLERVCACKGMLSAAVSSFYEIINYRVIEEDEEDEIA